MSAPYGTAGNPVRANADSYADQAELAQRAKRPDAVTFYGGYSGHVRVSLCQPDGKVGMVFVESADLGWLFLTRGQARELASALRAVLA